MTLTASSCRCSTPHTPTTTIDNPTIDAVRCSSTHAASSSARIRTSLPRSSGALKRPRSNLVGKRRSPNHVDDPTSSHSPDSRLCCSSVNRAASSAAAPARGVRNRHSSKLTASANSSQISAPLMRWLCGGGWTAQPSSQSTRCSMPGSAGSGWPLRVSRARKRKTRAWPAASSAANQDSAMPRERRPAEMRRAWNSRLQSMAAMGRFIRSVLPVLAAATASCSRFARSPIAPGSPAHMSLSSRVCTRRTSRCITSASTSRSLASCGCCGDAGSCTCCSSAKLLRCEKTEPSQLLRCMLEVLLCADGMWLCSACERGA
mmetsp:Transcript_58064/g.136366  ORF Transcript_58064/g.136366 Transcript_58064/m.136366 type:complete len:318 (-) Transcript_58064:1139-2092(-)